MGKTYQMEKKKTWQGVKYVTALNYKVKSHKSYVLTAQMQWLLQR